MSGVFISYRREDSAEEAHRLYRELSTRIGSESVFIDVANIAPSDDFAEVIDEKVGFCDALIAVIGKRWLTCTDSAGLRRLDDGEDWVRLEIASALDRKMKVFPVLVGGASLPEAAALPPPLAPMVEHQALEIRPDQFEQDVAGLAQALDTVRKRTSIPALWLSIIRWRHRALDPLDLHKPEALWRALWFLLVMLLIEAFLRLPNAPVPSSLHIQVAYFAAIVAAQYMHWLGAALALHFAFRAFGGTAKAQKSIATFCYLAAYAPLIALAQIPIWGLNIEVTSEVANPAWEPSQAWQSMREFTASLGTFGVVRMVISFLAATYLWWRLFSGVFAAFRTLHRMQRSRALRAFAVGLGVFFVLVAFVINPYFGIVYEKFLQ